MNQGKLLVLCFIFSGALVFNAHSCENYVDSSFYGFILDQSYEPVINSYIINLNTGKASASDQSGYFMIIAKEGDHLLFKNISFRDNIIRVSDYKAGMIIILKEKAYKIKELKIYSWGQTYSDFKKALIEMPMQNSLSEKLGFTPPDPDYIPFYLDEKQVKNPGLLLSNPISYIYYNLSRKEKIIR